MEGFDFDCVRLSQCAVESHKNGLHENVASLEALRAGGSLSYPRASWGQAGDDGGIRNDQSSTAGGPRRNDGGSTDGRVLSLIWLRRGR